MSARPTERAGYTTNVYVLDCSASMGEVVPDPELDRDASSLLHDGPMAVLGGGGGQPAMKTKLQWAKEYVMRRISEQIFYNRKTEHCMVVATGDRTNNPYEGYDGIDVVFPSYMAAQWMIERVRKVKPGDGPGDVLAGLSIALSTLQTSPHEMKKPSWTTNFHLITDGQSQLPDPDVQIKSLVPGLRFFNNKSLVVIGYGFQDKKWARLGGLIPEPRDSNLMRENETTLKSFTRTCRSEANCRDTAVMSLSLALSFSRAPQLRTVKPTAKAMPLRIAVDVFAEGGGGAGNRQSLTIPVKVAKMTDASTALKKPKVKPVYVSPVNPSSSGQEQRRSAVEQRNAQEALVVALAASAVQVDPELEGFALVEELERRGGEGLKAFNSEQLSLVNQLRALVAAGSHIAPAASTTLWNVLASDLQPTHVYIPVEQPAGADVAEGEDAPHETAPTAEVQAIAPEEVARGHRFGNGWIPVEMDPITDKPVKMGHFQTEMGIDVHKFIPAASFDREMEMGELRYLFADPKSAKSQVELASLIRAMVDHPAGEMLAVMRFVYNQDSAPFMVVARGVKDDGGDHLECVRIPFQDDYRRNYFPSLEFPKNEDGELVTEHKTLPTAGQMAAMGELIDKSIVDTLGEDGGPWFSPELSYNPSIHTLKAFQQHQALAAPGDVPPPMHQYLTRYFKPPAQVVEATKGIGKRVAEAFELRPVPAKVRRGNKDAPADDEQLDLFEMFGAIARPANGETSATSVMQPSGGAQPSNDDDESVTESESEALETKDDERLVERADKALTAFKSAWDSTGGAGDTVDSAVDALGKEIKSLVGKGSKDQALRCVKEMRRECLQGEESLAFNAFMISLKHLAQGQASNAFWPYLRAKGGRRAGLLTFEDDAQFGLSAVTPADADKFLRGP